MSKTIQNLLTVFPVFFVMGASNAQSGSLIAEEKTATFVFKECDDMFFLKDNEAELERLYARLDKYRAGIADGRLPIRIDGYCASLPTVKENLTTASIRANRVKPELITHKGLRKADFVTANYATAYQNRKDVVVVTLRISLAPDDPVMQSKTKNSGGPGEIHLPSPDTAPEKANEAKPGSRPDPTDAVLTGDAKHPARRNEVNPQPQSNGQEAFHSVQYDKPESIANALPYRFALRTNLLYDALLLPTLGVEWRINPAIGVRLDGSLSRWGSSTDKVQKIWMLNPEVRWYLLENRRFYVGVSGSYSEYNIYRYPLGSLLKDDTGYQGNLWNAGLSMGYQLRLCRHFSADFNLGLGYTRSEYNNFTVTDGSRISKERNKAKSFWGPTQTGINLIWTIGGNK